MLVLSFAADLNLIIKCRCTPVCLKHQESTAAFIPAHT